MCSVACDQTVHVHRLEQSDKEGYNDAVQILNAGRRQESINVVTVHGLNMYETKSSLP